MDSSTTTLWTDLFPTAGCLVSYYYYCVLYKFLYLMQTLQTLIRRRLRSGVSRLRWVSFSGQNYEVKHCNIFFIYNIEVFSVINTYTHTHARTHTSIIHIIWWKCHGVHSSRLGRYPDRYHFLISPVKHMLGHSSDYHSEYSQPSSTCK